MVLCVFFFFVLLYIMFIAQLKLVQGTVQMNLYEAFMQAF